MSPVYRTDERFRFLIDGLPGGMMFLRLCRQNIFAKDEASNSRLVWLQLAHAHHALVALDREAQLSCLSNIAGAG
eukprot:1398759-Pleurochrysis_carterae.AAC.1